MSLTTYTYQAGIQVYTFNSIEMLESLDTSGGITRYLRSKDTPLSEIILTANKLYSGDLNTYLPNKIHFLYDLLCDRLNDNSNKTFKVWKTEPRVWTLLDKVWNALIKDENVSKNIVSRKLKLVDSVINMFKLISEYSEDTVSLLKACFTALDTFTKDTYIEIDENQSILLLTAYLNILNRLIESKIIPNDLINQFTSSINVLFQLPRVQVTYKANKKNVSKFINECLPLALNFLNCVFNIESVEHSKNLIENIIKQTIFDEEIRNTLTSNIESAVSSRSKDFSEDSIELLFSILIKEVSSKDMKLCEDVFTSIVKSKKFNKMSENLLKILSKVNRALSHSFFDSIYKSEITLQPINWKLISYIIELDAELALENYSEIFEKIKSNKNKDLTFLIGENLSEAFLKSREFSQFFKNVWPEAIKTNQIWKSSRYIDIVSKKINDFSSNQLKTIATLFLETNDQMYVPLIISIIKGLLSSSQSKVDQLRETLIDSKMLFHGKSSELWEARYYLLCLYGDLVLEPKSKEFNELLSQPSKSIFFYYSLLRVIELQGDDKNQKSYKDKFVSYLQSYKSDDFPTLFNVILKRWMVMFNNFFDNDQIESILDILLSKLDWEKVLLPYFKFEADVFFEQPNVTNALISYGHKKMKSNDKYINKILELTSIIPVQCFDRKMKKALVEVITEHYLSSSKEDINLSSRQAIRNILSIQSSTSSIELNFEKLIEIFATSSPVSKEVTTEIVNLIWLNHLNQINSSDHEKYLFFSIDLLLVNFSSKSTPKVITPELEVARCILSSSSEVKHEHFENLLSQLIGRFTASIASILKKSTKLVDQNSNMIHWCLSSLYTILSSKEEVSSEIPTLIKEIGNGLSSSKDSLIKAGLFKLLSKISVPSFKRSVFITTLYISLYNELKDERFIKPLSEFYSRISQDNEVFEEVFKQVLLTAKVDMDLENSGALTQILSILITKLSKKHQRSHSNLFIYTLSIISSNFEVILGTDIKAAMFFLKSMKDTLSDLIWLFNQYGIELALSCINNVSSLMNTVDSSAIIDMYILLTQVLSHILLFHRFRLTSRHHILIRVFTNLLEVLSLKYYKVNRKTNLCLSLLAASAFSRVLVNLNEPSSVVGLKDAAENSLSSASAIIKKNLRLHVHIILVNYIYLQLNFNFESKVNIEVLNGIYSVFDVLSRKELHIANLSLDTAGRSYYRTLYGNYKEHGKWKDE